MTWTVSGGTGSGESIALVALQRTGSPAPPKFSSSPEILRTMRLLLLFTFCLQLFAQPVITAWTDPVIRYNDQYGPPKSSPGPNGCVGPLWNKPPCTGRWSYGDTFMRTWDGTNGWLTSNDSAGGQTNQHWNGFEGGNALFRGVLLGTISADNLNWVTDTHLDILSSYSGNNGSCGTQNGTPYTPGRWGSAGILAYHTNLYWWWLCLDAPAGWTKYHSTLVKSNNGFSSYTMKNHSTTPVTTAPALADMIFLDGSVTGQNWIQYARCPDNYNCPYTRPHGGETWAYMMTALGQANSFLGQVPVRVLWADLENGGGFATANYRYLTRTTSPTTCADGDVDANWSNDMAALAATACHATFTSVMGDIFYSPELNIYANTTYNTENIISLQVSSVPWFSPSTEYRVTDTPDYGSRFYAADLRTYTASASGGVTTITVTVSSSGNGQGEDFTASSNYSLALRTLHMSTPTPGGSSPPSGGNIRRFPGRRDTGK